MTLFACSAPEDEINQAAPQGSFFQWLAEESAELIIHFDRDSLEANRASEIPVSATLQIVRGDTTTIDVEISTRGVNRKKICDFPPIRLAISDAFVQEKNWNKPRKYKLVTDCSEGKGEHLLAREYLAYQLQAMHVDYFLQAMWLPVTFVMGDEMLQSHAILLEPAKEMARRLDAELIDVEKEKIKHLHLESYDKLVLFQYMIGNTDWNLTRGHNVQWIKLNNGTTSPIPVAYDFDGCGLVDAPYARPYATLPIKSVRERFLQYRGDRANLSEERDVFAAKKEAVIKLIVDSGKSIEEQNNLLEFLEAFYLDLPNITSG